MDSRFNLSVKSLEPPEIFSQFCDAFENYTFSGTKGTWQDEIVEIFESIGREAGFATATEFLRIDLTWYLDLPKRSFLEFALEHENHTTDLESVLEEVDKLRHVKAFKKFLIYYPKSEDISRHLSRLAHHALASHITQAPKDEWLVLTLTDDSDKWNTIDAALFALSSEGKWNRTAARPLKVKYA